MYLSNHLLQAERRLSYVIKITLCNFWHLEITKETFWIRFRRDDAFYAVADVLSKKWKDEKVQRGVAKRRDEESAEVGPTREAARISDPFDETPNVPLFAQQWRSNTESCPFRRSRRYFTYLRRGTRVGRDTPALLRLWPFTWKYSVRWESGFDKDIQELTDFFYRSLLNLPRCVHIVLKHSCDDCTNSQA